jgi:hypothetical protein
MEKSGEALLIFLYMEDVVVLQAPTKPSPATIALYAEDKSMWPSTNAYNTPKRIQEELQRLHPLLKKKEAKKYPRWQNKYDLLFAKKLLVDYRTQPLEIQTLFGFSRFSFGLSDFSNKEEPTLFLMEFSRYLKGKLAAADAATSS